MDRVHLCIKYLIRVLSICHCHFSFFPLSLWRGGISALVAMAPDISSFPQTSANCDCVSVCACMPPHTHACMCLHSVHGNTNMCKCPRAECDEVQRSDNQWAYPAISDKTHFTVITRDRYKQLQLNFTRCVKYDFHRMSHLIYSFHLNGPTAATIREADWICICLSSVLVSVPQWICVSQNSHLMASSLPDLPSLLCLHSSRGQCLLDTTLGLS